MENRIQIIMPILVHNKRILMLSRINKVLITTPILSLTRVLDFPTLLKTFVFGLQIIDGINININLINKILGSPKMKKKK